MNSKQSFLDTINTGRQRRPVVSQVDLEPALAALEERLNELAPRGPASKTDMAPSAPGRASDTASQGRGPVPRRTAPRMDGGRNGRRHHENEIRDVVRTRMREQGLAAVEKLAGRLNALREELPIPMDPGFQREFDGLCAELERAHEIAASGQFDLEFTEQLDQLSSAIRSLGQSVRGRHIVPQRPEPDPLGTVWSDVAIEQAGSRRALGADDPAARSQTGPDPVMEALHARLEQISEAIGAIPQSLRLDSLEEKLCMLAAAIERLVHHQERFSPEAFGAIDERLDEISRAIAASSFPSSLPSADPEPFERIEARITALARQIAELADEPPARVLVEGLATLSRRIDAIARHADLPDMAVDRLAEQITDISRKLDMAPPHAQDDQVLRGLEDRFAALSERLENRQSHAIREGQALFAELEQRLASLAERLEEGGRKGADDRSLWEAIDARFAELSASWQPSADGGRAMRGLEKRLETIASRLDQSDRQMPQIDPELIKNLEMQVAILSDHLLRPGPALPEFDDIGPRLDQIEQAIASNRDSVVIAARHAAEEAIARLGEVKRDDHAVTILAEDLKALERLARSSDQRNSRTFEALHETLLKIVDRLGVIENDQDEAGPAQRHDQNDGPTTARIAVHGAPLMEPDEAALLPRQDREPPSMPRFPAQVAASTAMAERDEPALDSEARLAFGTLARSPAMPNEGIRTTKLAGEPVRSSLALAADVEFDQSLDPEIANRPLEPGSGAPDLGAILKRVRDERAPPDHSDTPDTAKADFIAAARRAAQAAAAEAEALKRDSDAAERPGLFARGRFRGARRKVVLLAAGAILLALAGWQLGKVLLDQPGGAAVAPVSAGDPAPTLPDEKRLVEEEQSPIDPQPEISALPLTDGVVEPWSGQPAEQGASEPTPGDMPTDPAHTTAVPGSIGEPVPVDPKGAAMPPTGFETTIGPVALRVAVASGNPKALFEVASRYAEGRAAQQDLKTAALWYERAAELGYAPAQYRLGNLYEKGLGVGRDIDEARAWYRSAAEQGNANAMHNLAVLLATGIDGTADHGEAANWFMEAAERGVKDSQFNLGVLAAKGVGMPQDLEESYKWFALVAEQGDGDAAIKRDEVARLLSEAELDRARAATELWRTMPLEVEANEVEIPDAWRSDQDTAQTDTDTRQTVEHVQKGLNESGYDAGTADGIMGERTRNAIAAFQSDVGLDPTGQIDAELMRALVEQAPSVRAALP